MIKNARDDCEATYKLSVSAFAGARKKASEQREADSKAWSEIYQILVADAVDTDKRERYEKSLLCSPATASIRKYYFG
jgi:DNA-binding transcriptional regulator PaaX